MLFCVTAAAAAHMTDHQRYTGEAQGKKVGPPLQRPEAAPTTFLWSLSLPTTAATD